ncbi:MAG: serine/threonine-protein kinase, partial [Planctomycetota bacterium]
MSSEGQIGPQEWERVVELLATAKALDAADRERYLEAVDAPASVVAEVRRLLEQHPASAFLEPPSLPDQAPTLFGSGLVGARFGEFVLEDELGRGGMGVVYRARQLNLGRQVALKILPIASQGRMGAIERFRREARAAALLDHPNVVPVLAYGEDAGTFWYAMQYVEGHDLAVEIARQRMRRSLPEGERDQVQIHLAPFDGPQYLTEVVERFAELAQGVHHAHLNGIVHRDIKPQNILVDREGGLHLADFGLAKDARFDSLSRSGDVLGTPSYMSPEQARARRVEIDHRTDIYSLSVVLYELLALRPPHVGKSFEEVMSRILEEPPAPLRKLNPRVPQDLALVCGMGMEKAPEHRYGSAQALEDDLLRFQRHEAVLARGPSVRRIARGWLRRNRLRLGAAAIALASVVAGLQVASVRAQAREVAQVEGEARALLELDDWTLAIDRLVEVRRQVEGLGPDALRSETLTPFLERLDRFRDSTLEEGSARIAAGLGTPSADAFAPFLPPLRLGEIDAGLALLDGLQRLFPNDATVARAADPSRLFPSIDLRAELVDAGGSRPLAAGEGIATVETLDPFRDAFSDPRPLGPLPIEGLRLPPGHYRFTASIPGIGHAELLRTFEAGPRT